MLSATFIMSAGAAILNLYTLLVHFLQIVQNSSVILCPYIPVPAAPARQVRTVPTKVMPTSFFLTWCPPPAETTNGPITAYILECGESSGETPPCTISLSGGVEEHTVTGLKPHTEYYVKVAAVNAAGRGAFCEPVLVQTAPDSECCRV